MRKFYVLVKKEVMELLTPQMILPLIITALMFYVLGNVIGSQVEKAQKSTKIVVSDFDNGQVSEQIVEVLKGNNFDVAKYENLPPKQAMDKAKEVGSTLVLVIPQYFGQQVLSGSPQTVDAYTMMKSFSFIGLGQSSAFKGVIGLVNNALSNQLIEERLIDGTAVDLKNPVRMRDIVVVGDKSTLTSPEQVTAFISQQTTFIPIILFMVIIFAAQMIATTMATEKENKTLETLLSAPVSRRAIVGSKMVGAAIIAFFSSLVYMFGFRSYTSGFTGGTNAAVDEATKSALHELGLVLTSSDYVYLGLSLFAAILVALAIALILGAFAEDVKSVQGVITPLMVLIMVPYFLVLFLDFNALSRPIQYLVYAIPFSHPFLAAPNLYLGNTMAVIWGILYQLIVFLIFLTIAAKLFSSDHIMTLRLKFGKK